VARAPAGRRGAPGGGDGQGEEGGGRRGRRVVGVFFAIFRKIYRISVYGLLL
jgi:hypothetical protein